MNTQDEINRMIESHLLYIETRSVIMYEKVRKQQLEILAESESIIPQYQHKVNQAIEKVLLDIYNSNNFKFNKSLISIPKI